ncbi:ferritin-like domain-containing protein [Gordonia paraffinivorans]|uniref:ferritin-like domain-containing protein n=1 Tax=Gordonia paraffinivorans TaxID=175628 RepID=UPI0014451B1C|nr:ferritin-like domain-containing protein [Gordonia paraffinivorans]
MTTPVPTPSGAGAPDADPLVAAAEAENAAVFTYGVITAFVAAARRRLVADFEAEHRARRDEIDRAITAAGGTPPVAAAGYTLPIDVTGPESAARAALVAEEDCATAYRALLEQADDETRRRIGVDGLSESALRAARWRVVLQESPVTVAFPGSPVAG